MMTNKPGSVLLLAMMACVACAQPVDEMEGAGATLPMGTHGAAGTTTGTSTDPGTASTGEAGDSQSTDASSSSASTGSWDEDGTSTGGVPGSETGDPSGSGGEVPAADGFSDCAALDMVMCAAASQCLWEPLDDEGPGQGDCVADPTHCETLDQAQCGMTAGCGWGPLPGPDKGMIQGCESACVGVDQGTCEALPACVWSLPSERGVAACE